MQFSRLWHLFVPNIIHLSTNMRTGSNEIAFADWLLQLGNGDLNNRHGDLELRDFKPNILETGSLVDSIFGKTVESDEYIHESVDSIASEAEEDKISFPGARVFILPDSRRTSTTRSQAEEGHSRHAVAQSEHCRGPVKWHAAGGT